MKKKIESIKLDTMNILLNRKDKADGRLAEVRTGCGIYKDKRFKKPKHKKDLLTEGE